MNQPLDFTIALKDFDLYLLPRDCQDVHSADFREAVADYYANQFAPLGGTASVAFDDDTIHVSWIPGEVSQHPFEYAISLLKGGQLDKALPILEILLIADPGNVDVLFNYGVAESETGHLDTAISLLERAVEVAPQKADAWTALGFAYQRSGKPDEALRAMQRGVEADPENGIAQRNLGGMLGNLKRHSDAEPHLRAAARLMPQDQTALHGLAHCLGLSGEVEKSIEADSLYHRVIALDANSDIAERAKQALRGLAHKTFRNRAGSVIRMDAVMYCLEALSKFSKMDRQQVQDVTFEIGMLGQNGLDVNNPETKYSLRTWEGEFTGLHLVAIMYVGFKQISPGADIGFDLENEYLVAQQMFTTKTDAA